MSQLGDDLKALDEELQRGCVEPIRDLVAKALAELGEL